MHTIGWSERVVREWIDNETALAGGTVHCDELELQATGMRRLLQ